MMLKALTHIREGIAAGYAAKSRVTAAGDVGWRSFYGTSGLYLPGSKRDYGTDAGNLWENSVCMACISWVQRVYTEAQLQVLEKDAQGNKQALEDHPLAALLAQPNPWHSGRSLWYVTLLSYLVSGNAYWHKRRNGAKGVIELWPIWHARIQPRGNREEFISHYEYIDGRRRERIEVQDVVHFRWGEDPQNPRLGLSPWRSALREVDFDNRASTYTSALLRNHGTPGAAITPGPGVIVDEPARRSLLAAWREKFTGENTGDPLILGAEVKVEKLGMSPADLGLGTLRDLPETRICAAVGIAPMAVQLSVGEKQRSYANTKEAYEQSIEGCILPMQALHAEALDAQLLPDFDGAEGGRHIGFDTARMRALAPDLQADRKDAALLFQAGLFTRAKGLALCHEPFDEQADNVYIWDAMAAAQGALGQPGPGESDVTEAQAKALLGV